MMPCESAFSGYEVQGSAGNGTGSETTRGIGGEGDYGLYEQHWNSDIPFAAWQWWQASGNVTDLKLHLEPWLRGTAEFWASRVETHKGHNGPVDGLYHVNHVMPPDEYVDGVDDAVLTNFGAATILRKAVLMAKAAGRKPGANWTQIADKMFIQFDKERQYHPEYSGFVPGGNFSKGSTHDQHTVKQADVVLMGFPYDMNMSTSVRKNDLMIYANVTDPVSVAMTWGMFAVGWLEAAEYDRADKAFRRGYANIKPPFAVWTETPSGGTVNFITGAGGFLQSVVFGYGGLRLREDRLDVHPPPLPSGATKLTLNGLHYRGNKLKLEITSTRWSIQVLKRQAGATDLDLCDLNGVRPLKFGNTIENGLDVAASIRPNGMCDMHTR
jgi:trehalose/maltose hydrolase-like predicted phosphorylase